MSDISLANGAPMSAPRIAPGTRRDVGTFAWAFAQVSGLVTRTTPPNLFLTMGRQRKLFRGWLRFAGRLMPGGSLPRRDTELVILRVAHRQTCAYEFEHHVRLGKRAGVTAADVDRVQAGPDAAGWSPRESALLTAVDALLDRQDLTDDEWTSLRRHLDEKRTVEFVLLVGHYDMLATFLRTLRVQPDRPR
jgi:AhpD family alkylhydroperoxidase